MSILELESAIMLFVAYITLFAVVTIIIIYKAIKNKGTIQWYLKLKSSDIQVDKIIDEIFKRDILFDKLTKIWVSYNNVIIFLRFQVVVLLGGAFFAGIFILMQSMPKILGRDLVIYLIIFSVYFILYSYTTLYFLHPIILNTFKLSKKNPLISLFLVFITSIPPYLVLFYIIMNKLENNFNTQVAVYLILTTGMYETTKLILGFFLPTPPDGIYSTKELIQQISLALRGETNALKEIVDEANEFAKAV
jgi:hypothetical protein